MDQRFKKSVVIYDSSDDEEVYFSSNEENDESIVADNIFPLRLNPMLIPHVLETMFQSRSLSVRDFKSFRLVSKDWFQHATTALLKNGKCKIVIKGERKMQEFVNTFIPGQVIPSKIVQLKGQQYLRKNLEEFFPIFGGLMDSIIFRAEEPGTSIDSLFLLGQPTAIFDILQSTSILADLKHLALQCWSFSRNSYRQLDVGTILKITSLSLNNCNFSTNDSLQFFTCLLKASPDLVCIELSNTNRKRRGSHEVSVPTFMSNSRESKLIVKTLLTSALRNVTSIKIPLLDSELIEQFNGTELKLKHFHTDRAVKILRDSWTYFLTKQNELESFTVLKFELDCDKSNMIYLEMPLMAKLIKLHIGGGGPRHLHVYTLFEKCPALNELIMGYLPSHMMCEYSPRFVNQKITSLTLEKTVELNTVVRISKIYPGLRYLEIKLKLQDDNDSTKNSIWALFPNLMDFQTARFDAGKSDWVYYRSSDPPSTRPRLQFENLQVPPLRRFC